MATAEMTSAKNFLRRIYGPKHLSRREKFLSCTILNSWDGQGKPRSTMEELQEGSGYSDRSLYSIVNEMEREGFLTRTHEKFPDAPRVVTVLWLTLPDEQPRREEVSSEDKGEVFSDDSAEREVSSGNKTEVCSETPCDRQLFPTELKGLEPEDPEPEALDPKGQEQGQNSKHSATPPHVRFSRRTPEILPPETEMLARKVLKLYGLLCSNLPPAGRLSTRRTLTVMALIREFPQACSPDWWEDYFARAAGSSFLAGSGPRGWKADLDWLLLPGNAQKVLAGNYDDHSPSRPRGSGESVENFVDRIVAEVESDLPHDA